MTKEAGERYFDELASGLASGSISRGRALKLMGAALVGGALASVPGVTVAQRPAQAQTTTCPNPAEACCTCSYNEPGTPNTTFRTKCYVLRTRSCRTRRFQRLTARCDQLCEENRPRRLETQRSDVVCATEANNNAVCERVSTGPKCVFLNCTPP
jgi:hypothetical protein